MVIYFDWHGAAMDQKSRSSLPMTGEDTGLVALASPLVGYLGKVQKRAASLEYCPWCTSKGLTYALRSYRINLHESVTLCTNPQCLFPLVSRSLEDVLATLVPLEPTSGSKRRNTCALEKEELTKPAHKRRRSSEHDGLCPQTITDTFISQAEHGAVDVVSNGERGSLMTDGEKVNGCHRDSPVTETTGLDSTQNEDDVPDKEAENVACTDGLAPPTSSFSAGHPESSSDALLTTDGVAPALSTHCGAPGVSAVEGDFSQAGNPPEVQNNCGVVDGNQSSFTNGSNCSNEINNAVPQHAAQTARTGQKAPEAGVTSCKNMEGIQSETEDFSSTTMTTEPVELVPIPDKLFWKNSNNLCWLDTMLVALVNFKTLRKCKPEDELQKSCVWQLIKDYEDVCAAIQAHQKPGRDGVVRVPKAVLQKANADLQSLRMAVFKLLQPKLHCKLGQRETPVFAFPLLLTMDSWVEPLFQSTFHWEFKCAECKAASQERMMKTLPTFTKILPEWHPLHAVHFAPCNVCRKRNQRRTLILERTPPVFGLHFVEGLPDNDVRNYAFSFKGMSYSVTTVIQYDQQLKHFVTWICQSDGSWLEYDDLKHPECKTHQKLPIRAEEIHIVFWEVEEEKEPPACFPTSTFSEPPQSKNQVDIIPGSRDVISDVLLDDSQGHSLLIPHDDHDIISALSASEEGSSVMDITAADTSIGSTTLLDTFEGLTHNDIITLTLVEIKMDSDVQPAHNHGQTQDSSRNNVLDSTPDSSSTVTDNKMPQGLHVELLTTSSSSDTQDDSSGNPTFVPGARRGPEKVECQQTNISALSGAAPHISPPESSKPSKGINNKPVRAAVAQVNPPPVEATQQASPVSSPDTSLLSTNQKSPPKLPTPLHNSRWSYLLSKQPLQQVNKLANKPAPNLIPQVKPALPTQSTPNPVRRQQVPGVFFPKPQLKTEESDGLPLKAAEMYDAFGVKSSSTPILLHPSPELHHGAVKPFQPPISAHQKLLTNTTLVSGTSLPAPEAKGSSELSSFKKRSSHSSKVPPGLSDTEALRYKLIKKLKAKKKKLAKLNQMLVHQGAASLQPDSTDLGSPNTVTSSTYEGSICDDILLDLLSPATTASNLSPDSTGFLEMLASGQGGADQVECGVSTDGAASQANPCMNKPDTENFLEDFLSQAVAERPTEMEAEALSALDLFI